PRRGLAATLLLLAVAALLALHPAGPARAGTIAVTTTADELNSDGDCSLREAIQAANTDTDVDACDDTADPDVITLPAGTYTLALAGADDANAQGDLDILEDLTIQGAGAGSTVIEACTVSQLAADCASSGGTGVQDRVLHVVSGTVTISGVTIRHGRVVLFGQGGGILNEGTLTLAASILSSNYADSDGGGLYSDGATATLSDTVVRDNRAEFSGGGISNGGTLTVTGSTLRGNEVGFDGGGLYNGFSGTATFSDTTVEANTANDGGGIYNDGTLTLARSTLSGNNAGRGGGLFNTFDGTATLVNSTVSGNTAVIGGGGVGGGIRNSSGTLRAAFVTITGNSTNGTGGGLWDGSNAAQLRGVILAGNTASLGGADCNGTPATADYTLVQDGTFCTLPVGATGLQTGVDPLLGPLQANGGPTQTHALSLGSPALDAVPAAQCTWDDDGDPGTANVPLPADQRGVPRPQDGNGDGTAACDLGAFELQPAPTPTPTPSATPAATPAPAATPTPAGIRLPETGSGGAAGGLAAVPAALLAGALLLAGGALALRRAR
ncbi:MAG TPA: CSLREA domain-containing protein, partial [Dehalococcoidia bacterium]